MFLAYSIANLIDWSSSIALLTPPPSMGGVHFLGMGEGVGNSFIWG